MEHRHATRASGSARLPVRPSYTRRSLAWHRLKSADATRAAALRDVAQRLDCEIFLALADVHESWSCDDEHEMFAEVPAAWLAVA